MLGVTQCSDAYCRLFDCNNAGILISIVMLSVIRVIVKMLGGIMLCHCAKCCYDECHHANCHNGK
jgi:hypothetical protein